MKTQIKRGEKEPTAAEFYEARKADIVGLLDLIGQEVKDHAEEAARDQENWGYAGDLRVVRQKLVDAAMFMIIGRFGNSEEKATKFIEEHVAKMRNE
jgi:hypothetical protein